MKRILKKLYKNSPIFIKSIYSRFKKPIWENPKFLSWYNFLQESQWWSKKRLQDYQLEQLAKLLNHVYEDVPYYRRLFDERGIKPKDITSLSDLRKLPHLTKDIFNENWRKNEIIARNLNLYNILISHTSGTTGKPLQFYEDSHIKIKEWAFICHQWSRVGYKPGDKRVELRGKINRENPITYNIMGNVLKLSPLMESKEKIQVYLKKIKEFKAKYLHGYPGAIAVFANMIEQYKLAIPFQLEVILLASEAVYNWQLELIQRVFNCRVFSHYGMAEKVALAAECEEERIYHCIPQYSIVEFDPENNEIIGTDFINIINPFIRYRTTDIALNPSYESCKSCNRNYFPIFSNIEGRLEDFIVTSNGSLIAPAIITHPFKDLKSIKNTQIIQKTFEKIILRIIPLENSSIQLLDKETKFLTQELKEIIGRKSKIIPEIVRETELSPSGKFKWIISEVSKNFMDN